MSMFAKNLHRALSQRSIKQVDFARVLEVPPTTVSGWIRGAHEPSIDMLLKVCNYLNIPVGEMVGDKNYYVDTGEEKLQYRAEVEELRCKLDEVTAERDKYREITHALDRELQEVKRYGDKYRSMIETLKADGAKEISIKF